METYITERIQEHQKYSEVLKALREKTCLGPKEFGELLGLRERTIRGLERGTLKPPRDAELYEELSRMPNITKADINTLLRSEGAPIWLTKIGDPSSLRNSPLEGIFNVVEAHISDMIREGGLTSGTFRIELPYDTLPNRE